MPISTTSNQTAVVLATTSDVIPVTFPFFDASDLVVIKTDADDDTDTTLVISTHYSVRGGSGSGGSVTMSGHASLAAGDMITVKRAVPYTQAVDLEPNDPLPSATLERALDKLTVLIQQVRADVLRSFRVGATSDAPGEATLRDFANKVLGFDSDDNLTGLDADALIAMLNLPETVVDRPMKVWADDAARAVAVPDFEGQLGVQLDTDRIYYATGTSAGNWTIYAPGNTTITAAMLATDAVETAKIKDAAVTLAKMANLAQNLIIARKTGSTGVPEACTLAEVLAFMGTTRGDILVRKSGGFDRLALGTSGQWLGSDGTDLVWADPLKWVLVEDSKAVNTAPSNIASGAYRTLEINTERYDADNLCSISSNQVTLAAGTYLLIGWSHSRLSSGATKVRLRNTTAGTTLVSGGQVHTAASTSTTAPIIGTFTVAASQALELQMQVGGTSALQAANYTETETYLQALFIKLPV